MKIKDTEITLTGINGAVRIKRMGAGSRMDTLGSDLIGRCNHFLCCCFIIDSLNDNG